MHIYILCEVCEKQRKRGFEKGDMVCRRVQARREGGEKVGQMVENKVIKEEWNCLEFRLSVWEG